jgi:glycosyltransferase involved in cell wall biosynthesis
MTIYALMVARNEENRFLKTVLERLSTQVDAIIFLDDCSTDNTLKIAEKYAIVYQTTENLFIKDESMLRQQSWDCLSKHAKPGDWVVAIDADEIITCVNEKNLKEELKMSPFDVVCVRRVELWDPLNIRVDKFWGPQFTHRIYRYSSGGVFVQRVLACGSAPMYVTDWLNRGNYWVYNSIRMVHLGYLRYEDRKEKYNRYMNLDAGKYHNLNHLKSILDEDPVLLPIKSLGINMEDMNIS